MKCGSSNDPGQQVNFFNVGGQLLNGTLRPTSTVVARAMAHVSSTETSLTYGATAGVLCQVGSWNTTRTWPNIPFHI